MGIPDFQTLMRPLLELHSDGAQHVNRDLVNVLAQQFSLSEDERRQMLPSGRAKMFDNRVGWAKTYISNAGLIAAPRRAISIITAKGQRLLKDHAGPINLRVLAEVTGSEPARDRKQKTAAGGEKLGRVEIDREETPEEAFENAYLKIRGDVEREIIAKILANPPDFLERVIVDLVVRMGYGGNRKDAGEAIGRSGDEGIDGIIKEDPPRSRHHLPASQALRWNNDRRAGNSQVRRCPSRATRDKRHIHHDINLLEGGAGFCLQDQYEDHFDRRPNAG